MYTSRRNLPPSKIDDSKVGHIKFPNLESYASSIIQNVMLFLLCILLQIVDSIISHGSFLNNCFIEHSVVGIRSRVNSNVHLKVCSINSINMIVNEPITLLHKMIQIWSLHCGFMWFCCALNQSRYEYPYEGLMLAGYCDAWCWLLWNRLWSGITVGWGKGSYWNRRKYKNQVQKKL